MSRSRWQKPELQELHTRLEYVLTDLPKISLRLVDTKPVMKHGVEVDRQWVTGDYKSVDADGNVWIVTYLKPKHLEATSVICRTKKLAMSWEQFRAQSDEAMADRETVTSIQNHKPHWSDT